MPSRFNRSVFEAAGVTPPVVVVPHAARRPPPAAAERANDRFVFYLIATWSSRKAILDGVAAYVRAFTADDPVTLVIHTSPKDYIACAALDREGASPAAPQRTSWFSLATALGGHPAAPQITLSARRLSRLEVDALHARGDCFILLSHGEGWGLGAFEAAAGGLPVIVTGWGGTLEYLPDDYPYRVEYDLVPTTSAPPDSSWAPRPGERWANPRIPHAAALLRQVFERPDVARRWGRVLQSHVRRSFSQALVTRQLLDALDDR